jgi:glycerol uptake operon antiterminator
MFAPSRVSLLNLLEQCRTIPVVENRAQLGFVLDRAHVTVILLRHCNPFELEPLLERLHRSGLSVYVNVDHIDGIHPDAAGLHYLADHFHVIGIESNNPRILSTGKSFGLESIQRIFVADSTGLEAALESVDTQQIDLLDISPALVVPYIGPYLVAALPLPFIASGLVSTSQQVQAILRAGALGAAVARTELWL